MITETKTKERPILFSTPMVKAILEGRKTQTRRVMKPQLKDCDHSQYIEAAWKDQPLTFSETAVKYGRGYCKYCGNGTGYENDFEGIKCPYGKVGDILWVRETFGELYDICDHPELPGNPNERWSLGYLYKASNE